MQYVHGHLFLSDRRCLCPFVSLYIDNEVKIASLGGIEAIIKAMSTHKDHSGVQENACSALWNLAANDGMCSSAFVLSSSRETHLPFLSAAGSWPIVFL